MAFPSLEGALNKVSNRYLLVVLAAKRARQINRGAPGRVETKHKKPTSHALEEIAASKAVYLLRELTRLGAGVTVCLTEHASGFVSPLTFRTLSGRPVLTALFDPQSPDAVEHVALAERAHAILVAPATANLLAKAAHGS